MPATCIATLLNVVCRLQVPDCPTGQDEHGRFAGSLLNVKEAQIHYREYHSNNEVMLVCGNMGCKKRCRNEIRMKTHRDSCGGVDNQCYTCDLISNLPGFDGLEGANPVEVASKFQRAHCVRPASAS